MKDGSHATAITHARTSKPSCDHAAFSRQCDLTLTVLGPKQSLKGLENGVDGIILRVTDKDGAGARAGVVDGDLLQSIGGKQCVSLDYDVQLKLVIDAKGTGVVDVGVLRRGAVAETSLSNTADDINRTQSYLVANPKVSSQKYFFSFVTPRFLYHLLFHLDQSVVNTTGCCRLPVSRERLAPCTLYVRGAAIICGESRPGEDRLSGPGVKHRISSSIFPYAGAPDLVVPG